MDAAQMGGDLRTAGPDLPGDGVATTSSADSIPTPVAPPPSDVTESQSLLERAQQYADQIQADAEAEAKAMRLQAARALDEARRRNALAESLLGDAQEEAKQLISDAAEQAHLVSEATNRSAQELSSRVEQDAQSIRDLAQQDADRIRESAHAELVAARTRAEKLLAE